MRWKSLPVFSWWQIRKYGGFWNLLVTFTYHHFASSLTPGELCIVAWLAKKIALSIVEILEGKVKCINLHTQNSDTQIKQQTVNVVHCRGSHFEHSGCRQDVITPSLLLPVKIKRCKNWQRFAGRLPGWSLFAFLFQAADEGTPEVRHTFSLANISFPKHTKPAENLPSWINMTFFGGERRCVQLCSFQDLHRIWKDVSNPNLSFFPSGCSTWLWKPKRRKGKWALRMWNPAVTTHLQSAVL